MIVWDLGDVVALFRPERRLAQVSAASGIPEHEVHERIWASGLDAAAEIGTLTADELWVQTIAALGGRLPRDEIRRCWASAFEPNPVVVNLIDHLAGPSALLTNNGPILKACFDHELRDLAARFDHILFSCDLGATKPSTEAFTRAAEQLGADPRDLLLIDDQDANVAGARAAGWSGIQYRREEAPPEGGASS